MNHDLPVYLQLIANNENQSKVLKNEITKEKVKLKWVNHYIPTLLIILHTDTVVQIV